MIEKYILDDDDLLKCQIVLLQNAIRHKINVKENQNKLNFIVQFLNIIMFKFWTMINKTFAIFNIFEEKFKKYLLFLLLIIFLTMIMETLSIGMFLPLITSILSPDKIENFYIIQRIYNLNIFYHSFYSQNHFQFSGEQLLCHNWVAFYYF